MSDSTLDTTDLASPELVDRIVDQLLRLDVGEISRDQLHTIVSEEVGRLAAGESPVATQPGNAITENGSATATVETTPQDAAPAPIGTSPSPRPMRRSSTFIGVAVILAVAALIGGLAVFAARQSSGPDTARSAAGGASAQPQAAPGPPPAAPKPSFEPQYRFTGSVSSSPYEIKVGDVQVVNGKLTVTIGQLEGMDAVYDYLVLRDKNGTELRFEAEDARYTSGDQYAANDVLDGHWWLQQFGGFSGDKGLVVRKMELAPVLTTEVSVPNGTYTLGIGSFTGDKDNGVFALGVAVK